MGSLSTPFMEKDTGKQQSWAHIANLWQSLHSSQVLWLQVLCPFPPQALQLHPLAGIAVICVEGVIPDMTYSPHGWGQLLWYRKPEEASLFS